MSVSIKKSIGWYIILITPLLGAIIFNIYPLIKTLINSVQNSQKTYIGAVNYSILFSDEIFIYSISNTVFMAIIGVGISVPIAFIIANMLNNIPVGKNFYKILFLLPMVMSMITVGTLFKYLFAPGNEGIVNNLLSYIHIGPFGFFNDPEMSRQTLVVMAIWKNLGYNIIIFFAGLQVIPREQYEAAKIDGASEFKQWIYITIPSAKNTFTFVIITSTIGALKRFADVYAISGETGNPAGSLNTIMLYIYKNSFSTLNYKDLGRASAASIILFVIILVITMINFRISNSENTIAQRLKGKKVAK